MQNKLVGRTKSFSGFLLAGLMTFSTATSADPAPPSASRTTGDVISGCLLTGVIAAGTVINGAIISTAIGPMEFYARAKEGAQDRPVTVRKVWASLLNDLKTYNQMLCTGGGSDPMISDTQERRDQGALPQPGRASQPRTQASKTD